MPAERTSEKQPINLQTCLVSREHVFNIGIGIDSGQHYLFFPVSNRLVDYEEHYRIDADDFACYLRDMGLAPELVEHCRRRQIDHLLLIALGNDRGNAL